ncbi:Protein hgh1 [Marasmius crinis-equi]|uniref:Protein HGH1 homolog n=1 Tax=Marasmius crinis-equi TaxID=585013 RepID=A0ABR3FBK5_9AGAR
MEGQLKELLPFLRDKNPQVRQLALENLVSQTPKGSPYRSIFFSGQTGGLQKPSENDVIRDLKLLCRDQLAVAHDAFKALVNLSDAPILVSSLSDPSFLNFLVSYIVNPQSICADLASMLLSNLTASSSACATLLTMKVSIIASQKVPNGYFATQSRSGSCVAPVPYPSGEEQEVLALPLLLDAFIQGAQVDEIQDLSKRARKGSLHFMASVFGNLTSSPAGREFFLTPQPSNPLKTDSDLEYPLAKIVSFTEHRDTIRRGGVISIIKNCAFNARAHKAILSPETERVAVSGSDISAPGAGALPYIILPLAGPEEFELDDQEKLHPSLQFLPPTKTREPDSTLRLALVETLLLLSHTRWGRDFLRANGVYEIIRAAHEVESVDKISEHMERLVMLIKSDEPAQGPSEEEEFELAATRNGLELEDSSAKPTQDTEEEGPAIGSLVTDDDDEDNRIEEV